MKWMVSERADRSDLWTVRDMDTDVVMQFPDDRTATRIAYLLNELCVKYFIPAGEDEWQRNERLAERMAREAKDE
jgi:hypothetical protein